MGDFWGSGKNWRGKGEAAILWSCHCAFLGCFQELVQWAHPKLESPVYVHTVGRCTHSHCSRSPQALHVYAVGPVVLTKPCSNFFRAGLLAIYQYFLKNKYIHITQPGSHMYLLFLRRLWEQDCLVDTGTSPHLHTFWLKAECLLLGDGP